MGKYFETGNLLLLLKLCTPPLLACIDDSCLNPFLLWWWLKGDFLNPSFLLTYVSQHSSKRKCFHFALFRLWSVWIHDFFPSGLQFISLYLFWRSTCSWFGQWESFQTVSYVLWCAPIFFWAHCILWHRISLAQC